MIFEIHAPDGRIVTLNNAKHTEGALLAVKGFSNGRKYKHDTLVLYKITENSKERIDPNNYDMKYYTKHRQPNPQHNVE